jgi:DNA polymerase V
MGPTKQDDKVNISLFLSLIHAGFPSPADDYVDNVLDLNELVISHPAATFFVRVKGTSMINALINEGDVLVVDRSLEAFDRAIVVAILDGEFTVKRLRKTHDALYLLPENPEYKPIQITDESDFQVWGVVTYIIHKAR